MHLPVPCTHKKYDTTNYYYYYYHSNYYHTYNKHFANNYLYDHKNSCIKTPTFFESSFHLCTLFASFGLTHLCRVDSSTFTLWTGPFTI